MTSVPPLESLAHRLTECENNPPATLPQIGEAVINLAQIYAQLVAILSDPAAPPTNAVVRSIRQLTDRVAELTRNIANQLLTNHRIEGVAARGLDH